MNHIIKDISVKELIFDPQNPRFSMVYNHNLQPEHEIIERMVKKENIQELMGSISEQGYFSGEPLLVVDNKNNTYTVVEGNRRLAALKLLNKEIAPTTKLSSIESIIEEAKIIPDEISCMIFDDRRDILRYLSYRHITGPKKWDSLSKAIYIKQLREEFFSKLSLDEQLRALAKEMGSRKDYVAKMLTTLNLLEYAEKKEFFGLKNLKRDHIEFSILTTALGYTNLSNYIGLPNGSVVDVDNIKDDNAKDIFAWMFLQNESGETILGESRNLGKLSEIVTSHEAVDKLKKDKDIKEAYLFTTGPENTFLHLINYALTSLKNAYEIAPLVNKPSEGLIKKLEDIEDLNENLIFSLRKKIRKISREEGEE
ncbi:ParB N-terminal domain-containing protein [Enterobacter hormaechei]|uniref:ParB N-terminal domain-containing protein n=1 Tax=Enterobacter hormaechei TaxID=158836 RepID=UPI000CD1279F|nr:ParB N-terminal domain-containing protein [Enterobacter hormaechei]PNY62857.1 hypothetical protein C2M14_08785 [Enterobacter cloacae]HDT3785426.1 ParB N-terminal domain-containing protein [Enterobacter hormaechei subsp. steigerwaltii]MBG0648544.1 ParB N-terminal domain-containing protein [Enterobacter hormaechei]MCO7992377.1 ParB/Srx family N-terminal domain-containing protein [Enterobacter hormaechei]MCO8002052.1 ParB/Srx family N-terminal domain-containing protein [Enterobacter hormaechei